MHKIRITNATKPGKKIMAEQNNEIFMRKAIELARQGEGKTNPNPLVGAVIVKDGIIIGQGFHTKYGELHAEREALADCLRRKNDPRGADIYVTLEPCCHFGKQPPCTHAILESGIKRVFVGSRDPNPLVHGKGNAFLRENGIEVTEDFLREECDELNPIFFHYITTNAIVAGSNVSVPSITTGDISGSSSLAPSTNSFPFNFITVARSVSA